MDSNTLKYRHPDAEERATLYSFLLDAWDGTGGFAPPLDETISGNTYGQESNELPDWKLSSYIDRFPRESADKWRSRVRRAHYTNTFRAVGETICNFLLRRLPERKGGDDAAWEFLANADGRGTSWNDFMRHEIARRVWAFASPPILVDRPAESADNKADRKPTFCRVLWPGSLYDWETDDAGEFEWAKIVEKVTACESAEAERVTEWRATEWTREGWRRWTWVEGEDDVRDAGEGTHPCGRVPIVLPSLVRPLGSSILGTSPAFEIAQETRKLFNYQSLLDEHLYGQVYAVLAVTLPIQSKQQAGGFKLGTDNALMLPEGGSASFIAPPQSVADTLFKAIDACIRRMYRAARIEFTLREGGQAESGVARQYEFAATDRSIRAFADEMARVEVETQRLVALWDGRDPDVALADYVVEWPDSYDVKDLERELANALRGLEMQLGPTAEVALRKIVRDDLVTLDDASKGEDGLTDLERSDREIEEAAIIAAEPPPLPPIMPPPERPGFGQEAVPMAGSSDDEDADRAEEAAPPSP